MEKLIVFLVIIVFSIIKSMIDKSAERKAQQAQQVRPMIGRPPANHRDKVQSEIEAFLTEVRAGTTTQRETESRDSPMRQPAGGTPYAATAGQQPAAAQRPNKPQRAQQGRAQQGRAQQGRNKSGQRNQPSSGSQKKRAETDAANRPTSMVRATAAEYENQQIGLSVQPNRRSQIDGHALADRSGGARRHTDDVQIADGRKSTGSGSTAASLIEALRSPAGMRQAIIVSEVLSRPRSLR
jgi:hypothetical protein